MSAVSLPRPLAAASLRSLAPARARQLLAGDALAIDLRPVADYLAGHIRGSIPLLFEPGPGLGGRARDLLPLDAPLVLLDDGTSPLERAADSFRGRASRSSAPLRAASRPGRIRSPRRRSSSSPTPRMSLP